MKQKMRSGRGGTLLKWHALAFTMFIISVWGKVLWDFSRIDNVTFPYTVDGDLMINRIGVTIVWGVVLLAYFVSHQLHAFRQYRAGGARSTD